MSLEADKNRISRIRDLLGVDTDQELIDLVYETTGTKLYKSNISRWRKSGFSPAVAALIDTMLTRIDFYLK